MKSKSDMIKKRYDRISNCFNWIQNRLGDSRTDEWRDQIIGGASGKILEVGVGTGRNIKFYSNDMDITAIDFSRRMLSKAKAMAKKLDKNPELVEMDVQHMSFPDDTFDFVFTTFVFCSVPEPMLGLKEIKRVLKPGGKLVMLEHVRIDKPVIGKMMDVINPLVVRLVGANINRRTVENVMKSGFIHVEVEDKVDSLVKLISAVNE